MPAKFSICIPASWKPSSFLKGHVFVYEMIDSMRVRLEELNLPRIKYKNMHTSSNQITPLSPLHLSPPFPTLRWAKLKERERVGGLSFRQTEGGGHVRPTFFANHAHPCGYKEESAVNRPSNSCADSKFFLSHPFPLFPFFSKETSRNSRRK